MTATRHPVADLLTDEMRARVAAARFYRDDDLDREFCAAVVAEVDGVLCCPLGVALGVRPGDFSVFPGTEEFYTAIADHAGDDAVEIIDDFMYLVDTDQIEDPADVYALFGVEARP